MVEDSGALRSTVAAKGNRLGGAVEEPKVTGRSVKPSVGIIPRSFQFGTKGLKGTALPRCGFLTYFVPGLLASLILLSQGDPCL